MKTYDLDEAHFRKLVAVQYINATREIFRGMKQLVGSNNFLVLVCLRSFIEYTRRGIWLLFFAKAESVLATRNLSFMESGTDIITADKRISNALQLGDVSSLLEPVPGVGEPFIKCLHALTHGNPIITRVLAFGLDKYFNTPMLVARAEVDYHMFFILVGRQLLGQNSEVTWKTLTAIHKNPDDMRANALIVADLLRKRGDLENILLD